MTLLPHQKKERVYTATPQYCLGATQWTQAPKCLVSKLETLRICLNNAFYSWLLLWGGYFVLNTIQISDMDQKNHPHKHQDPGFSSFHSFIKPCFLQYIKKKRWKKSCHKKLFSKGLSWHNFVWIIIPGKKHCCSVFKCIAFAFWQLPTFTRKYS